MISLNATPTELAAYLDDLRWEETLASRTPAALFDGLKALQGLDRWEEALRLSVAALGRFPDDIDLNYQHARMLYRAGQLGDYHDFIEALAKKYPDHPEVNLEIAKLFLGSRDPELAAKYLNLARDGAPLHPEVLLTLGHIRFFMNAFDEAKVYYERYLENAPIVYPYEFANELIPSFVTISEACVGKTLYEIAWGPGQEALMPLHPGERFSVVDVTLDGEGPYHLLVDTGGGMFTALSSEIFEAHGGTYAADLVLHGMGGRQDERIWAGLLPQLELGQTIVRNPLVLCFDFERISRSLGQTVHGILSPGWLLGATMTWDTAGRVLSIRQSDLLPVEQRLTHSESNYLELPNDTARVTLPMYLLQDSKPVLPIEIEGKVYWFIVDSGAERTFFSRRVFERTFEAGSYNVQEIPSMGIGDNMGVTEFLVAPGLDVFLGDVALELSPCIGYGNIDVEVSPRLGFEVGGVLGHDVLRQFDRVSMDFRNAQIVFEG